MGIENHNTHLVGKQMVKLAFGSFQVPGESGYLSSTIKDTLKRFSLVGNVILCCYE